MYVLLTVGSNLWVIALPLVRLFQSLRSICRSGENDEALNFECRLWKLLLLWLLLLNSCQNYSDEKLYLSVDHSWAGMLDCDSGRVAWVWEGVFVLIRIFLNSGKYCEHQRRKPLGVSWGNCSPRKFWNLKVKSSLPVNISNSIKSKTTGILVNNNISVWLGTFIHSDTYRLSTRNVLQKSTCAERYLAAKV